MRALPRIHREDSDWLEQWEGQNYPIRIQGQRTGFFVGGSTLNKVTLNRPPYTP